MWIWCVYELSQSSHSSSAIDKEGGRAPRKTAIRDRLSSDSGYLIGRKHSDRAKESAATSRSFESDSNVIDVSDTQDEKQDLQSTSTDDGR
jgi:hypothetical protein